MGVNTAQQALESDPFSVILFVLVSTCICICIYLYLYLYLLVFVYVMAIRVFLATSINKPLQHKNIWNAVMIGKNRIETEIYIERQLLPDSSIFLNRILKIGVDFSFSKASLTILGSRVYT